MRRCSTCGRRCLTFGGLMRHYLRYHPIAVEAAKSARRLGS